MGCAAGWDDCRRTRWLESRTGRTSSDHLFCGGRNDHRRVGGSLYFLAGYGLCSGGTPELAASFGRSVCASPQRCCRPILGCRWLRVVLGSVSGVGSKPGWFVRKLEITRLGQISIMDRTGHWSCGDFGNGGFVGLGELGWS